MTIRGVSAPSESREHRQARLLDEEIERLRKLRDDIDPTYAPSYVQEYKSQGWFGRMCSRISLCIDFLSLIFWTGIGLLIAGMAIWVLIQKVIESLF